MEQLRDLESLVADYNPAKVDPGDDARLSELIIAARAEIAHGEPLDYNAGPLVDIISALNSLAAIDDFERYFDIWPPESFKKLLMRAIGSIETAGRCLTRYLENNGGLEYLKAVDPLKYNEKYTDVSSVNLSIDPIMHTHGQFAVRDEDCALCMRQRSGERRQSPSLISYGKGPKEFA